MANYKPLKPVALAFNDKLSLIDAPPGGSNIEGPAKDWARDDIIKFLNRVVKDPEAYGVPKDERADLPAIRDEIGRLSLPYGIDFQGDGDNLNPKQHIYRGPNPAGAASRFYVRNRTHGALPYWSPHDLLGLFISKMGPAPTGAAWDNYFMPLLYVYGKWCARIASNWAGVYPGDGVGDPPYMLSATWVVQKGKRKPYVIGASLAGYEWNVPATGTWESVLALSRYNLVDKTRIQAPYHFNNSPRISKDGNAGTRFGNCAETYAFARLFKDPALVPKLHGIALQRSGYQGIWQPSVQAYLFAACANCKYLIGKFGGTTNNFEKPYVLV